MRLTGLHLLLTYRCNLSCDHCFVWGGPRQTATMTLRDVRLILDQAVALGGIEWVHFEGGEPFLFEDTLLAGVMESDRRGFQTGIVTNGFWATDDEAALARLQPFAGHLKRLSISTDAMHWRQDYSRRADSAAAAAGRLGIAVSPLNVVRPIVPAAQDRAGRPIAAEPSIMYRGRAARALAPITEQKAWDRFTTCPHEDLRDPKRVHLDPLGYLHVCQGIAIGNVWKTPLADIARSYGADQHPIAGPLANGGPAGLARRYGIELAPTSVDACHLCYEARLALRAQFPGILAPDAMYGGKQ